MRLLATEAAEGGGPPCRAQVLPTDPHRGPANPHRCPAPLPRTVAPQTRTAGRQTRTAEGASFFSFSSATPDAHNSMGDWERGVSGAHKAGPPVSPALLWRSSSCLSEWPWNRLHPEMPHLKATPRPEHRPRACPTVVAPKSALSAAALPPRVHWASLGPGLAALLPSPCPGFPPRGSGRHSLPSFRGCLSPAYSFISELHGQLPTVLATLCSPTVPLDSSCLKQLSPPIPLSVTK